MDVEIRLASAVVVETGTVVDTWWEATVARELVGGIN